MFVHPASTARESRRVNHDSKAWVLVVESLQMSCKKPADHNDSRYQNSSTTDNHHDSGQFTLFFYLALSN